MDAAPGDRQRLPTCQGSRSGKTFRWIQVELEHADPYLVLRLLEPTVIGVAAGHVDHDVDSTESEGCVGEGLFDRGHVGHIQPNSQVAAGLVGEALGGHLLGCILIKVGHRHPSPFLGQPGRTRPADAVSSTGDNCCRTCEASEVLCVIFGASHTQVDVRRHINSCSELFDPGFTH
jgi:hypothetical protein